MEAKFFKLIIQGIVCLKTACIFASQDFIVVNKKDITHQFVRIDKPTDHFTQNVFPVWENETFEIFDQVKDKEAIAIDIGAWIGTTAIWLAKNFHHVVAIEPDYKSVDCLKKNLAASDCWNFSLCDRPLSNRTENVIFGPRGPVLNESISYIKNRVDNDLEYTKKSITFKQLIYDYIYDQETLKNRSISFIKCDIEGGEEDVLEDILHFAYNNQCKVYLSFHLDWWKSKTINEFEYLFKYFKTNCPEKDICQYLTQHPWASLLFEPLDAGVLVKKNMTAVVIGYNQYTFIKNMVGQLEKYTSDIVVIDNASTYQPLLDYYANDFKYTLLKQKVNDGPGVYSQGRIQKIVGDLYILTDPDLQFNPNLPENFIREFIDIMNEFGASRVGFALFIDSDDIRTDITFNGRSIKDWESQFWQNQLIYSPNPNIELYNASIDTTFCLINRRLKYPHIRVAGDYTCFHIPWYKNFQHLLAKGEYQSYLNNNISTNWFKNELDQQYEHACYQPSDINEHVKTLRMLAMKCSSVVEIGVRTMVSTWGILKGLSENPSGCSSYLGIDIDLPPSDTLNLAKKIAEENGISFSFLQANDMTVDLEPTDMLFIDSLHTYCHLTYELEKFSPKVSQYIAMHDTSWGNIDDPTYLGDYSEYPAEYDRTKRGLWQAIEDFLKRHPEWTLIERRFNNYGFTILKRISSIHK